MKPRLIAQGADLSLLAEIHAASFAQAWTTRALNDLLAVPGSFAFSTETGFILARVAAGEAEILSLAVNPNRRRRGTATALVRVAADHAHGLGATEIFLEVAIENTAACGLYAGLGFHEVGRRQGYYGTGLDKREDALILRSILPLSPLGKRPAAG